MVLRRDWRVWFDRNASARSLFTCADTGVSTVPESEDEGFGLGLRVDWELAAFSASRAVVRARRSETEGRCWFGL